MSVSKTWPDVGLKYLTSSAHKLDALSAFARAINIAGLRVRSLFERCPIFDFKYAKTCLMYVPRIHKKVVDAWE